MKLYDMLDRTKYDGKVYIVAIDKNEDEHFIFKGRVDEARTDSNVWDFLLCKVDQYYVYRGVIVIKFISKDIRRNLQGLHNVEKSIIDWIGDK